MHPGSAAPAALRLATQWAHRHGVPARHAGFRRGRVTRLGTVAVPGTVTTTVRYGGTHDDPRTTQ
eukprot:493285-Hanusia_phi.AAC.1